MLRFLICSFGFDFLNIISIDLLVIFS